MIRHPARVTAAVVMLVFLHQSASETRASAMYSVTDLGTWNGKQFTGLNDAGQLTGLAYYSPNSGKSYAFVYQGDPAGTVTPLGGSADSAVNPVVRNTFPVAINNSGLVVATDSTGTVTGTPGNSFLYANGQTSTLPGTATALNDSGQVAGYTGYNGPSQGGYTFNPRGYLYNVATQTIQYMTAAGASPTVPFAVNNAAQATGDIYTEYNGPSVNGAGTVTHPFLYSNGRLTDLGTLGGTNGWGQAINSQGVVVGWSETGNGQTRAFLYSTGTMKDLGVLPADASSAFASSVAYSINNLNQVVGVSDGGTDPKGFLYSNGVMKNLNDLIAANSGWTITSGNAINNNGQILAIGQNSQGLDYLLLTPAGLPVPGAAVYPTIIPEPSTWMLFGGSSCLWFEFVPGEAIPSHRGNARNLLTLTGSLPVN